MLIVLHLMEKGGHEEVETEGGKVVEEQMEVEAADRWQFCHRDTSTTAQVNTFTVVTQELVYKAEPRTVQNV